jgi:hypothetical protein
VNLDFGLEPGFSWYVVLLCLSGIVMVAMAAVKAGEQSTGSRALSAVAGLGFLGYGIYLGFIFDGGSYWMFFQAFILPILLVVNFVRTQFAKNQQQPFAGAPAPQYPAAPPAQQYPGAPAQQYPGAPAQQYPGAPAQQYPGAPAQAQYADGSAQPQHPAGSTDMPRYAADPAQPQHPGAPTQPGPTQPS